MYLKIKDQNIYYQKLGKGPDLIMLHGWKNDVSSFLDVAQVLKDDFTVWLIDLPGFGRSELTRDNFTITDFAETIKEFILEKKIKKPNILGHSLGGNVSIKLAAENPELTGKLVLEDSSGIRPKKTFTRQVLYILAKAFKYLTPDVFNIKIKLRKWLYWKLESDYLNAGNLKNTLVNILNEDLTQEIPKIKNETLILWGEDDETVTLKYARMFYRLIPNSRLEIIEKAGHHPHLENPKMFLYYVKDFLK